jgi:hypothetical protein
MAVFTAIATAIVEYAVVSGFIAASSAAFAVSVVATGLAIITARVQPVKIPVLKYNYLPLLIIKYL